MSNQSRIDNIHAEALTKAAEQAIRAIPPVWPLTATVAVNPFLGQSGESLSQTAERLGRIAGISLAMPRSWYAEKIAEGSITDADLLAALTASKASGTPDLEGLKSAAKTVSKPAERVPTVADLALQQTGQDWPRLISDRVGAFCGGYFDEGQALWAAPKDKGLYSAWRAFATHDLTPEIAGLKGFGALVADLPETAEGAIERVALRLGIGSDPGTYFHQLLLTLGGWAQYARHNLWNAELAGRTDLCLRDLLAVRLVFEEALYLQTAIKIGDAWKVSLAAHRAPIVPGPELVIDGLLQSAAEYAAQRRLSSQLLQRKDTATIVPLNARPSVQAAFCIDVRSEVFRRALETTDTSVETLGFAGFFGLGAAHRSFGSDVVERRLPVLLNPGVFTCSQVEDDGQSENLKRFTARAARAWGRFKLAAVSSFAFVEAMGPVYGAKLLKDSLGLKKSKQAPEPAPSFATAVGLDDRINMAETVLRAMSLTERFARIVLLAGHGANVVNNPFASALHCGACGGYSGEVNARLLAGLLNDADVRKGLIGRGITVPEDTLFLAGLHDTTTDAVILYSEDAAVERHQKELAQLKQLLATAGRLSRLERAQRLPGATGQTVENRSRDWAEIRPEWALAGCQAFIAAPRNRTNALSLEGRAFLHDYVWRNDQEFKVLELILTAPVVVASWISLQYYGSAVAPSLFGSGNKLLHNIVGGIGVFEGNGGLMRAGLPWQSVHDGEKLMHEPLRLSVMIEAPCEAMTDILRRHPGVRELFDNGWLHLFSLDDQGNMAWRYGGDLKWQKVEVEKADKPARRAAG
ncbi:DUF2309 domain-containing protein [Peteryoungia desertarenae]|uniref:Probable inorganic carbon transporter subunit DabA n=1 Tax=Peteryoungia desertarenae TaxID=1813451 RepID=A0ABX6QIV5_9HYPH|nr:DUF2309 domain-containing protein [Peteryoungia desertarenae]QLF68424.1 DUF2309 domain-containing protein [Peteryoungia desertarenae]